MKMRADMRNGPVGAMIGGRPGAVKRLKRPVGREPGRSPRAMLGAPRERPDVSEPVLRNYIGGRWEASKSSVLLDVEDPAEAATIARVPVSTPAEVDAAVRPAQAAFREWRQVPPPERVQPLFRLKQLLEERREESGRHDHRRERQGAGGGAGRGAPHHRQRGGGLRHPFADAGAVAAADSARHRRGGGARAAGRLRGDPAVQLPGHGAVLVLAVRRRLRQRGDTSSRPSWCPSPRSACSS